MNPVLAWLVGRRCPHLFRPDRVTRHADGRKFCRECHARHWPGHVNP